MGIAAAEPAAISIMARSARAAFVAEAVIVAASSSC
jgi:hypothetical protein